MVLRRDDPRGEHDRSFPRRSLAEVFPRKFRKDPFRRISAPLYQEIDDIPMPLLSGKIKGSFPGFCSRIDLRPLLQEKGSDVLMPAFGRDVKGRLSVNIRRPDIQSFGQQCVRQFGQAAFRCAVEKRGAGACLDEKIHFLSQGDLHDSFDSGRSRHGEQTGEILILQIDLRASIEQEVGNGSLSADDSEVERRITSFRPGIHVRSFLKQQDDEFRFSSIQSRHMESCRSVSVQIDIGALLEQKSDNFHPAGLGRHFQRKPAQRIP